MKDKTSIAVHSWVSWPLLSILLVISIWGLSFYLIPLLPEDSAMSLGPALGLIRYQRLYDPLIFTQYPTYMGWPPGYIIFEVLWFRVLGINIITMFALILFNVLLLGGVFLFMLQPHHRDPIRIACVITIVLSSGYFVSGRLDAFAVAIVAFSVICVQWLAKKPSLSKALIWGSCLALAALTHPLVGFTAAVGSSLILLFTLKRDSIKYIALAGLISAGLFFGIYLPIIFSDLATWQYQFLGVLALGQDHFLLSAPVKFWALNSGFVALFGLVIFRAGFVDIRQVLKNKYLWTAILVHLPLLTFGMSYYYSYAFPVWALALLDIWKIGDGVDRSKFVPPVWWKWIMVTGVVGSLSAALFIGPGVAISQAIRKPEYRRSLLEARQNLRNYTNDNDVILTDIVLLPAVIDRANVRMWFHAWNYGHSPADVRPGTVLAMSNSIPWKKHTEILGNWEDPSQYDVIQVTPPEDGLPRVFNPGNGPSLGLILVRKK